MKAYYIIGWVKSSWLVEAWGQREEAAGKSQSNGRVEGGGLTAFGGHAAAGAHKRMTGEKSQLWEGPFGYIENGE
jgi:hypothetical protein